MRLALLNEPPGGLDLYEIRTRIETSGVDLHLEARVYVVTLSFRWGFVRKEGVIETAGGRGEGGGRGKGEGGRVYVVMLWGFVTL